jgi:hypothetical protein
MPRARQGGQSSVELVALIPALVVVVLLAWQIAATAHAWLSAGGAARAAARAAAVGASGEQAARATLPHALGAGAEVHVGREDVRVRVRAPRMVPWLPSLEHEPLEAASPVVRPGP